MEKWIADPNADYLNDPEGLAKKLLDEAIGFHREMKEYDPNDGFYDYLMGLVSARLVVIGRLGYDAYVPENLWESDC